MTYGKDSARMEEITRELDKLASGDSPSFNMEGWNSSRMRVFIAAKLCSYQKRCLELEERLKFEQTVGERVVKIFKDTVSEKSSSKECS